LNVLVYLVGAIVCYLVAYRFYGRYIGKMVGEDSKRPTPALVVNDGKDYVPTRPPVLFAHHFSTIAGAGPIVGPTLGILYGIGPAWLWVVLGAIFFGMVHDFVALFASIREQGHSVAEIARKALGPTGFLLFISFTIILIVLVTSAFLSLTAVSLTSTMPLSHFGLQEGQTLLRTKVVNGQTHGIIGGIASMSVIVITALAPLMGYLVVKRNMRTWLAYVVAAAVGFLSVWFGFQVPVQFTPTHWMVILAIYTLFACEAPVWLILQPRDFVNVQILYAGMLMMALGVVLGGIHGLSVDYPVTNLTAGAQKMGPVWPFLFITIACGAISGFHALVSGGTTSKQLTNEGQARAISCGGMLLESSLAVLVLLVLGSSLKYADYMAIAWPDVGQGNPILAFAVSMGTLLYGTMGIPVAFGSVMGILVVEGFLITTLDSAVRLNRYLFEEFWKTIFVTPPAITRKFWFNSGLAVVLMLLFAWNQGYKLIWPIFGAANQLLAALTLIAVTVWLHRMGKRRWFTLIPALVMLTTTIAALSYCLVVDYVPSGNFTMIITDGVLLILSLGVLVLSLRGLTGAKPRPDVSFGA
jgi:carbon starvation protein